MRFQNYEEVRRFFDENGLCPSEYDMIAILEGWSGLKKGLLAGSLGLAALAPFAVGSRDSQMKRYVSDTPSVLKMKEELKDKGIYYDHGTAKKIIKMAEEGDEWAIRELPWPEGHRFHKMGRPFHRNTKPHPEGLIRQY